MENEYILEAKNYVVMRLTNDMEVVAVKIREDKNEVEVLYPAEVVTDHEDEEVRLVPISFMSSSKNFKINKQHILFINPLNNRIMLEYQGYIISGDLYPDDFIDSKNNQIVKGGVV